MKKLDDADSSMINQINFILASVSKRTGRHYYWDSMCSSSDTRMFCVWVNDGQNPAQPVPGIGEYLSINPFFRYVQGLEKGMFEGMLLGENRALESKGKDLGEVQDLFENFLKAMDDIMGGGDTVARFRDHYYALTGKKIPILGD
jgi:hypothetical protein